MKILISLSLFIFCFQLNASDYCSEVQKKDVAGNLLYPNKKRVLDTHGNYLYPSGNKVKSFSGIVQFPNGKPINDIMGNYYYPNGKRLLNSMGDVLLPDGTNVMGDSVTLIVLLDKKTTAEMTILKSQKKISNILSVRDEYIDHVVSYRVDLDLGKISDLKCLTIFRN